MVIDLNLSVIGGLEACPIQVIAVAEDTKTKSPVVQLTTTRENSESEYLFICRLRGNIRHLVAPYGYAHHVTLHCRYKRGYDALVNDEYQNISKRLWFIADHSPNHVARVKALSRLMDMTKIR